MVKLTSKSKKAATKTSSKSKKATSNGEAKNSKTKTKIVDLEDDITDQEEDELVDEMNSNGSGPDDAEVPRTNSTAASSSSSLLADCEKYFGSRDLYSILNLDKAKANESEIKKAYYKFSLKYHPDKADETNRNESTIKFQVLSKIYSILSDAEKKKLYDEQGIVDDESGDLEAKDWNEYWRTLFKKVTKSDFDKFFAEYCDSAEERADLLRAYDKHEGDMSEIMDDMFTKDRVVDEPRFRQIIEEAIEKDEVKIYKKFSSESKQKAARRKAAYEREAIEAKVEMVKQGIDESEESLRNAILSRRQAKTGDFLSQLEKKYAEKPTKARKGKKNQHHDEEQSENEDDEIEESKPKKARGAAAAVSASKNGKAGATKKIKRL